jgi:hypothetical protein
MKKDNHMSDKELDALFKASADQDLPDFQPDAWEEMEKLLDEHEGGKGGGVWRWSALFAVLLLLSVTAGYVYYQNNNEIKTRAEISENESGLISGEESGKTNDLVLNSGIREEEELSDLKTIEKERSLTNELNSHGVSSNNSIDKGGSEAGEVKSIVTTSVAKNKATSSESIKNVRSSENQVERNSSTNELSQRKAPKQQDSDKVLFNESDLSDEPMAQDESFGTKELENSRVSGFSLLDRLPFSPIDINFYFPQIQKVREIINEKKAGLKEPKLGLRLAFSPDFSTVHDSPFLKVGHNYAALLEFKFNNRWSVQSGVVKSLKFYQAEAYDYAWPANWGYKTPEGLLTVDARCNMLDIPLNLRYNFTTGRNRWFISGGLTNYLMLKETYNYNYEETAPDQRFTKWEGKTGFYDAGDINTSIGFERQLVNGLSFQVEPFLKVPIQNIGFGKVKLLTTGVFISAKIPLLK